jgi:CBS domain-containing protein
METKVKDIMNKRPRTVNPDTSIDGLLERTMTQIEVCFPVVDKNQKLLGIVTESDLLQVLHPQIPEATIGSVLREVMKSSARTVGEIMTARPITVTPNMTIADALNLMVANKLRRLPVVEGGRLVGLLSLREIIELYRVLK